MNLINNKELMFIIIIDKSLGTGVFCFKNIHVDRNENEDNRKRSCPQSTTSELLAVNMMQLIEMRVIGKTIEIAR